MIRSKVDKSHAPQVDRLKLIWRQALIPIDVCFKQLKGHLRSNALTNISYMFNCF